VNGMKLAGILFLLLAVGCTALAMRQYQNEAAEARLTPVDASPQATGDQAPEAVKPVGWEVTALGAVALAAIGAICLAKSAGTREF
jgi:hypothetical protein